MPLLKRVRELHPGITLYLNENYGVTLSELIMSGRMDMAVLYGGREIHGLDFIPLLRETLYLVSADATLAGYTQIKLAHVAKMDLLLPRQYKVVRRLVDEAFARLAITPNVIAQVESASTLRSAVADRFAATILPESAARALGTDEAVLELIAQMRETLIHRY